MSRQRLLITVAVLLLAAMGVAGCGTAQPASPEPSAGRSVGPGPSSGSAVSAAMPGSSAEQGTSAPEPSKRAQAKAPGSEPETAQEKAEAALVARAMAL